MKPNKGWAIHLHHDILVEWCRDYKERKKYIIKYKRKNEIKPRLRLFKLLPIKAVSEIPIACRETGKAYQEAYEACRASYAARAPYETCRKTYETWRVTDKVVWKAGKTWRATDKAKFHEKWCGCKEWNGKKLIFGGIEK